MLTLTGLVGFGAGAGGVSTPQFLYDQIVAASLSSNLKFVLDAGDPRCYDGSSQTWTDATGNGNNFYLGGSASVESLDPSFNGSIGSWSDSTYFGFNGSQHFKATGAHSFAANWHKNNGLFTIVAIIYVPTLVSNGTILSTKDSSASDAGVNFFYNSTGNVRVRRSETTTVDEVDISALSVTQNSWNFVSVSWDEAATTIRFNVNGSADSFSSVVSTDTDNHNTPIGIGASPANTTTGPDNGTRIAAIAAWNSALSAANLTTLYNAAKVRIPAIP